MSISLTDDQRLFLKRKIERLEFEIVDLIPMHDKYSLEHEWEIVKKIESKQRTLDSLNKILYYNENKALVNLIQ